MKVGCAAIFENQELLNESSIYSAEVTATDLATNIILNHKSSKFSSYSDSKSVLIVNHKSSKFIIYSDSKSVLIVLQNKDTSNPFITKLLNKMNTLSKNNRIILTWIPSHIVIHQNISAVKAAKQNEHSFQK